MVTGGVAGRGVTWPLETPEPRGVAGAIWTRLATSDRHPRAWAWADCAFLAGVLWLTSAFFLTGLGFYSDDWWLLNTASQAPDQSFMGVFGWLYSPNFAPYQWPIVRMRPVQVLYQAALYTTFGAEPLGYHLVNTTVLTAAVTLLYIVLREMGQARLVALSVALVYALAPHYTTDRFWVAAFQATLSMALVLGSLYAALRATRPGVSGGWAWGAFSLALLTLAGLAYEVVMPLALLTLWLLARRVWPAWRAARRPQLDAPAFLLGGTAFTLGLLALFKAVTSARSGFQDAYPHHVLSLVAGAASINLGGFGLGLPVAAGWLAWRYPDPVILAGAVVLGGLVAGYLALALRQAGRANLTVVAWPTLVRSGLGVFALGYAIFLTNANVGYSSAGISNRVAIAGAAGVALAGVGLAGWLCQGRGSWRGPGLFGALITGVAVSGFLITTTLGGFWQRAYQQERVILAQLRADLPDLPTGATLLLDAVCPYHGPAIVFEAPWDVTGALRLLYRDPTLRGDVVTSELSVTSAGVSTRIYDYVSRYPYGDGLLVYNVHDRVARRLTDAATAHAYLNPAVPGATARCPAGEAGRGAPVLPWPTFFGNSIN